MPLQVSNPNECPPGYWRYSIPELSGKASQVGPVTSRTELLTETRKRYCSNALMPPPDLEQLIDEFMCGQIPPDRCRDVPVIPVTSNFLSRLGITLGDAVRGTTVFVQWQVLRMTGERVRVNPQEANKRASICATSGPGGTPCEKNVPINGCFTCHAGTLVASLLNVSDGQRTSYHDTLGGCAVCGCGIQGKVWMEKSILLRNLPQQQRPNYPKHCWLLRDDIV